MKKALTVLVFGFVLGAQASYAETIVLGEYKGSAKLISVTTDEKGNESSYENNCTVAINVEDDGKVAILPFGVVNCENGMDSWNEIPMEGTVEADGALRFEAQRTQQAKFVISHIDHNCRPSHIERKTIDLNSRISFILKPMGGESYQLTRTEERDLINWVYKKEWPNCGAGALPVVNHLKSTLEGTIAK